MKASTICKVIKRIYRILVLKKGIYGTYGRKNRFCSGVYMNERTMVGSYNYFGERVVMFNVRMGNYCSIANSVKLGELEHDLGCISTSTHIFNPKYRISNFAGIKQPTVIEDDVWIGSNAVVLQGVTVHRGAVIGAGAIVTQDVPPYAIVVGVPARVIRFRFDEAIIDRINNSIWWEKDLEEARAICGDLQKHIDLVNQTQR